jgi:maltooligosyltrehalose trehalohydrolase
MRHLARQEKAAAEQPLQSGFSHTVNHLRLFEQEMHFADAAQQLAFFRDNAGPDDLRAGFGPVGESLLETGHLRQRAFRRQHRVDFGEDEEIAGGERAQAEGVFPGSLYFYRLDDSHERPDPASHSQPQGVHGPSQVVAQDTFLWDDAAWRGLPLAELIIYELHVGTFTPAGTFEAIIPRLGELRELGITAIELMPVAQFPGARNWGYDSVYLFAPHPDYGGPEGLKKLVNACHQQGLAVILDVVYNHLGPEGNYLESFAPYFTDKYRTPWGKAVNFDGAGSDEARNFFGENALYWLRDFHLDGLRLDAIHAICDLSARPFLRELAEAVLIR